MKKNLLLTLISLLLLTCAASCGNRNEQGKVTSGQDSYLTQKLLSEDEISDGQIYLKGEYAMATMVVKEGVSQKQIDTLTNEYAKKIKNRYRDKKVNVQAVQGNKNVANVTL